MNDEDIPLEPEGVAEYARQRLREGAYISAAIVIFEYSYPGEEDINARGPFLAWTRDTIAGRWTHLGMVESVATDCRAALREGHTEDPHD